jgi:hypothetical protein
MKLKMDVKILIIEYCPYFKLVLILPKKTAMAKTT